MSKSIEIPFKKKGFKYSILGYSYFGIKSIYRIYNSNDIENEKISFLILIVSICTILYSIFRLRDNRVAFKVDTYGITDRTNFFNLGLIKWQEIYSISVEYGHWYYDDVIFIELKDPDKFTKNSFQKICLRLNKLLNKTHLIIPVIDLNSDARKICVDIMEISKSKIS